MKADMKVGDTFETVTKSVDGLYEVRTVYRVEHVRGPLDLVLKIVEVTTTIVPQKDSFTEIITRLNAAPFKQWVSARDRMFAVMRLDAARFVVWTGAAEGLLFTGYCEDIEDAWRSARQVPDPRRDPRFRRGDDPPLYQRPVIVRVGDAERNAPVRAYYKAGAWFDARTDCELRGLPILGWTDPYKGNLNARYMLAEIDRGHRAKSGALTIEKRDGVYRLWDDSGAKVTVEKITSADVFKKFRYESGWEIVK